MEVTVGLKKCLCQIKCCVEFTKLITSRHFRVSITVAVLLFCSLPFLAINIPFSKLYEKYHKQSDSLKLADKLNSERITKALQYFNETDATKSFSIYKERSNNLPEVVVSIVTVNRYKSQHKTSYLIQTSAVIDRIVKSDTHFSNMLLFICNVDQNPHYYSDALFVQQYIPYVQKYGTNSFGRTYQVNEFISENTDAARKQEFEDYIFCMNVSKSFGSPYVLLLEDDVVPYKNVFSILHYSVKQHNLQHFDHLNKKIVPGREFAFLKLYYPERWQGYANEVDRILELISVGVLGGAALLSAVSLSTLNSELTYPFQLYYFLFGTLLTIMSVLIIGRHNVIALRRISPQLFLFKRTPGCCTPAMFYSSHVLADLMQYLVIHSEKNKDLAINDFIKLNNIPGYILEPNLFRHIGMYTSLTNAYKAPDEFIFNIPQ